jgi:hypothetical protein
MAKHVKERQLTVGGQLSPSHSYLQSQKFPMRELIRAEEWIRIKVNLSPSTGENKILKNFSVKKKTVHTLL